MKSALSSSELQKYAGTFAATERSEGSEPRTITLDLKIDQTFTMEFSYEGRAPIPPFEGTWTLNGDLVEALVTKPAGMEERYVFRLEGDTLVAEGFSKGEYGEKGLALKRTAKQ